MKTPNSERELVLLLKKAFLNEQALEKELTNLEELFQFTESEKIFCRTHELAQRNGITRRKISMSKIYAKKELKPFCFLICIN